MITQRWRPVVFATVAVAIIWAIAMTGYTLAKNSKMTAEKVKAYAESLDFRSLSAADRAEAIKELADRLNSLSLEERRKARLERAAWGLFEQMTEQERSAFLDMTMPTGFKQMLTAFEELPDEKRRRAIDDAMRRLREAQSQMQGMSPESAFGERGGRPELSEELQRQVTTIGLKAYYSQSSAQTKAELAPVLEELQRVMESGRPFRRR
jgi:hypothetical protein